MEKRPPENDLSYRDQLPKPGHTGDLYVLGADGENLDDYADSSFLRHLEERENSIPEKD